MNLKSCQECKTEYQNQKSKSPLCPKCGSQYWTLVSAKETSSKVNSTKEAKSDYNPTDPGETPEATDIDRLIAVQKQTTLSLIAAQNKTTHAVRAFVRFLFIQLSGLTAAGLVWYVSLLFIDQGECINYGDKCDGNAPLQLLAIAIWIGTVIFSSNAAWSELGKSDIH
jgi:hypothetical protein